MTRTFKLLFLLSLTALIFGCAHKSTYQPARANNLIQLNHRAAASLLELLQAPLSSHKPILVTSLVNIDDLTSTTTWGRMTAEQLSSALFAQGHPVLELKLRNSVLIERRKGEFILSREIQNLTTEHDIDVVLTGTYAVAAEMIYATIRLIQTTDNRILSSHDYAIPLGLNEKSLLGLPAVPYGIPSGSF